MTGSPNVKRVQGLVPAGSMPANEEDLRQFVNEVNGISTKEGKKGFEKFSLAKRLEDNKFKKTRDRMISNVMGINPEVLKDYYKARGVNTSGIAAANDEKDIKWNEKSFKIGQKTLNVLGGSGILVGALKGLSMGVPSLIGALAAAIIYVPLIATGKIAMKGLENIYIGGAKQREKQRELLKKLEPYRTRIDALEKEITKNYNLIESNRKTMGKKEFEAWQQNFTRAMCERVEAECGPAEQRQA